MTKRPITIEDLLRVKPVGNPQMSPDGKHVVFTVKTIDADKNRYRTHLWMADIEAGTARQFTHGEVSDGGPRWSPDGRQIAFERTRDKRTQLWVIPRDGGEARQLTCMDDGDLSAPAWSPDGKRLAFSFRQTHPDWTAEAAKKREEKGASNPPRVITRINYRLDGAGFLDLRSHIWTCDADTGEAAQLTQGDFDHEGFAWSPDGRWIAFVANRSDDPEARPHEVDIWLVPTAGGTAGGEVKKVPTPLGYKMSLSWSPDGRRLAYTGYEVVDDDPWLPRNIRLWAADIEGGGAQCLTESLDRTLGNFTLGDTREYGGGSPLWSKDGERLYFIVSDRGSGHVYAVASEGGEPVSLTRGSLGAASLTADSERKVFALQLEHSTHLSEVFIGSLQSGEGEQMELRPLTQVNASFLETVQVSEPEEVWFKGYDGTALQGWLIKPPDFDAQRKHPLVLYIHGGPHAQYGHTFLHEFQAHAARGYLVLYTNPRGSMGYTEEFAACIRGNWGSVDYDDIMAAADFAASLPYVDSARMAVAGGSYGGYLVNWIVAHTDRFRCAVTDRTVSNLHADFGTVDVAESSDGHGYWEGNAWDSPEKLWQQSPLRYAANIHTPLLIIHSEGDLRCPIHHAEQLFAALKHLKREALFVRYPLETSHGMSRSGPPDLRIDRLQRIAAWLDKHLKTGVGGQVSGMGEEILAPVPDPRHPTPD